MHPCQWVALQRVIAVLFIVVLAASAGDRFQLMGDVTVINATSTSVGE